MSVNWGACHMNMSLTLEHILLVPGCTVKPKITILAYVDLIREQSLMMDFDQWVYRTASEYWEHIPLSCPRVDRCDMSMSDEGTSDCRSCVGKLGL